MTGRCLIVANQTLGGGALERAVKDSVSRGVGLFYVVVPTIASRDEAMDWSGGFAVGDEVSPTSTRAAAEENERRLAEAARRREAVLAEARNRAEERLEQMIERIQLDGGQAAGEVGADDPLEATRAVLAHQAPFDEIIVSTLPRRLSRWLRLDLPARIGRLARVPVTTVEADD